MKDKHVNQNVEVVVLPSATGKKHAAAVRGKVQRLIREKLLLTTLEPYHKVQVEVKYRPTGPRKRSRLPCCARTPIQRTS